MMTLYSADTAHTNNIQTNPNNSNNEGAEDINNNSNTIDNKYVNRILFYFFLWGPRKPGDK